MASDRTRSLILSPVLTVLLVVTLLPTTLASVSLTLVLPPTQVIPQPQTLPPSTHARLTTGNHSYVAPFRRTNRFVFPAVAPGSYLADVYSHEYVFVPMRVDVAEDESRIEVWQTFRGNEWSNVGEKLGMATRDAAGAEEAARTGRTVSLEVNVGVLGQKDFYEKRSGFNPLAMLKNPMILMAIVAMAMMFGMPKLIENMDPEMREEFDKQQSSGPLAGLASGNPTGGFDMAAWMAGTDKKDPPASGQASGAESKGGKRRR